MKTTSAQYLLPLLLAVGLPVACSGSTDKIMDPGDGSEAGSPDDSSSGGSKNSGTPGEGGGVAEAGKTSTGGHVNGGSSGTSEAGASEGGTTSGGTTSGNPEAGAGPDSGGAGSGGDGLGGAGGEGGTAVVVVDPPLDPTVDGADDNSSGRYRLHSKSQPKCLAETTGEDFSAEACTASEYQEFYIDGAGKGLVHVRRFNSTDCLGMKDGVVGAVTCNDDANLVFEEVAGGYFQLVLPNQQCVGAVGNLPVAVKCDSESAIWYLDALGTNFSRKAKWTATSTFPGYSTDYAHDGDRNAGLDGHGWANNWNPPSVVLPQEVNIDLGAKKQFSLINVFTASGYEIGSYDLDYWDGAKWVSLAIVKDNVLPVLTHAFPTVVAQKLRFTVRRGPEAQFIYTRLNEVEIY